jgi:dTDP-glucose 4,6-dehydratase
MSRIYREIRKLDSNETKHYVGNHAVNGVESHCVFVTGGAGFIGSAVIRELLRSTKSHVVNIDSLTYAGNLETLSEIAYHERYDFSHTDIRDRETLEQLFKKYQPSAVMHLAAETHVDRSIDGPNAFLETNIMGTYELLQVIRGYLDSVDSVISTNFRFHHISTDEVYGSLGAEGKFTEESPYQPRSPYAASKAASDHLVYAWAETYGIPAVISNCSNNYGPYQYPEKLIPVAIGKALDDQPIPIYGSGNNIRDWLYVDDHARALLLILEKGQTGRTYNVGGNSEKTNLSVVQAVCNCLDQLKPRKSETSYADLISFVSDRPGHDFRYAVDSARIHNELGWQPRENFLSGVEKTVKWYLDHQDWVEAVLGSQYHGQRLGLGGAACEG